MRVFANQKTFRIYRSFRSLLTVFATSLFALAGSAYPMGNLVRYRNVYLDPTSRLPR